MFHFLQTEVKTLFQQKDYNSLYCDILLWWSGTKLAASPRYACIVSQLYIYTSYSMAKKSKSQFQINPGRKPENTYPLAPSRSKTMPTTVTRENMVSS